MIHMICVILQEQKWQKEFHFDLKSFEHFEFVGIRQYFSAFDWLDRWDHMGCIVLYMESEN